MTKAEFIRDAAEEIKQQRVALGITRADIAAAIGVSTNSVKFWEEERGVMSAYSAALLQLFFKRKREEKSPLSEAAQ